MKKLSILCSILLVVALVAGPAAAQRWTIDVKQDGIDNGGSVNLFGQTGVLIDLGYDGYSCAPDDDLFGAKAYVTIDETLVDVTSCDLNTVCDPTFSRCEPVAGETNVWIAECADFNFISAVPSLITATMTVDCVGTGTTDMVMDVTGGTKTDGSLSDCNFANIIPDAATVTIEQLPPPCACEVTGPVAVGASAIEDTTEQYTASQVVGTDCAETPVYEYSDDCAAGDVDPVTGLLTVPPYTGDPEVCNICAVDTANTGVDPCCLEITISPGQTCDGEIYLGGAEGCDCLEQPPVDDPPYNRPGRRGLALTCGDIVDFCACDDCTENPPTLEWTVECSKPDVAVIVTTSDCTARLTVLDTLSIWQRWLSAP
jgi:hypothetical protein